MCVGTGNTERKGVIFHLHGCKPENNFSEVQDAHSNNWEQSIGHTTC